MRIGLGIGIAGGGKPVPGSLAVFTAAPTIEEDTGVLTVTPGDNTLTISGVSGFPITVDAQTPEILTVEIAFP